MTSNLYPFKLEKIFDFIALPSQLFNLIFNSDKFTASSEISEQIILFTFSSFDKDIPTIPLPHPMSNKLSTLFILDATADIKKSDVAVGAKTLSLVFNNIFVFLSNFEIYSTFFVKH